jgi:hypothetical protein
MMLMNMIRMPATASPRTNFEAPSIEPKKSASWRSSPALARLVLADQAGVEVGVDRHLLARHRVQGEARGDFGDAAGALGDHDEVDEGQDAKHDDTDRVVATDQEVAEGLDHLAGGVRAGVPFKQHDAGRGDVERQAQQRRHQQHRRENREIQRLHHVDRHQHDHDRDRDVEGEEHVEHEGGSGSTIIDRISRMSSGPASCLAPPRPRKILQRQRSR